MGFAASAHTDQAYDFSCVQRDFEVPIDNTGEVLILGIGDDSLE
jgi:hypothetical protein